MADISIHALREESDELPPVLYRQAEVFQSTLSVRRATQLGHASAAMTLDDFNPRSP